MAFNFNEGYNRSNFINFLRTDLFGDNFVQNYVPIKPERKTAFFVENGIFQLGSVQLGDEEISVIEIKQSSKNDPRVTLTQDAFKIMGDLLIDNAIVALYVDNDSSWRFSLLTTKYEDFKKTTSNPKRFSFILGPNEKIRTVNQQLINKGKIKNFEDLVSRFDVEVVRKEFFETYLELFVRLYKEIQKDKQFADLLVSQNVDLVSFTKNLLGKIIFLYFVQQKGWLGLGKHTTIKYGEGNKDFMRKLWINFKQQGESLCTHEKTGYFYNDYLEWLFFAGLNVDRRKNDDRFEQLQMKLPYLNGGLFKEEYEGWQNNISKISNDIFSNKDEDGILDIFDRYNFTIDEDSLYDTDIAVDPEMLGRIFEKMISISSDNIKDVLEIYNRKKTNSKFDFGKDLNKKLGAFYTPRKIVHYMTKESLVTYLHNKTNISEENIKILFDLKEKFLLNSADMKKAEYSTEKLMEIGNSVIDIDEALKNVKILDPAVGSGAFPMGLLHEISSLRYYIYKVFNKILKEKLDKYLDKNNDVSLYKIKREIILNNIHGIDIDPGAIDIAKLRFRLSLVVDEEEPEPLPNFEFKFISADSLIPLEEGSLFTKADVIEKLKNLRDEYYKCDDKNEKDNLKHKFYDIKRELTGFGKSKTDFSSKKEWDEYLIQSYNANADLRNRQILEWDPFETKEYTKRSDTELMMGQDKFDIVIGNPPYGQFDDENMKATIRNLYSDLAFKIDMYNAFILKGMEKLSEGAICYYIIPNTLLDNFYSDKIRKKLLDKKLLEITDLNDKIFKNVVVHSMIIGFQNKNSDDYLINIKKDIFNIDVKEVPSSYFRQQEGYNFLINAYEYESLINKFKSNSISLGVALDLRQTIKTGNDKKYITDTAETVNHHPILRGKDITKYGYTFNGLYVNYGNRLANPINKTIFEQPKILIREAGDEIIACYDESNYYIMSSLYNGIQKNPNYDLKYILGLLNSKLFLFFMNIFVFKKVEGVFTKARIFHYDLLFVKEITKEQQQPYIDIVNKILDIKKNNINSDTSVLEIQLDKMIYELYGLTDEEIQIVEDGAK